MLFRSPSRPLVDLAILDDAGKQLPQGQVGEISIRSVCNFMGYWNNEEATKAAYTKDMYFRTGDLGQLDGQGGFTFLSRMGDVLRLSGFLVNPLEIETHVQKVPGIEACTAIALPRPDGVRAIAFVILKPGATLDDHRGWIDRVRQATTIVGLERTDHVRLAPHHTLRHPGGAAGVEEQEVVAASTPGTDRSVTG